MYSIKSSSFFEDEYGNEHYLKNWPMLYILENETKAYIGQSTSVITRMSQHRSTTEKQDFENVHFIYSKEFNQSVTLDYESKLIQLFAADRRYVLTNANGGLSEKNYYNKSYYEGKFQRLWEMLRKKKLVKHTIDEIVNSDLFKYSPYKVLNESQRSAVDSIFASIQLNGDHPIIVHGMPGSGKTIVAIFLYKYLRDYEVENKNLHQKKMAFVVPQTSLRKTLKNLFKNIYGLKASEVIGPSDIVKNKYDIVIVDEAHRLHQRKSITNYKSHDDNNKRLHLPANATELDWIISQVTCPILFFDKNQVIGPSGITAELLRNKIDRLFKDKMVGYYTLDTQMRVKGGNGYIDYITNIIYGKQEEKKEFSNYEFKIVNSFKYFEDLMLEKEEKKGLSRMVAGYAWPWISKQDKSLKDIKIQGLDKMWNNRTENWVHCETAIDEVGCIHSIQGYDLNYAFVILGNDIQYDKLTNSIVGKREHYYDKKGKAATTDKELTNYIKNIYYVLMTRGIEGTYLYICDPALKKYMENYIDVV